jgi:uncharacterized membrane protein/glutaredoxin
VLMRRWVLLTLVMVVSLLAPASQAATPVVRAILFWDRTCPHCHVVLTEVLPPIQARYGSQFQLLELEMSQVRSYDLFLTTVKYFQVPQERRGVPLLVIGDKVLVGEDEITQQLPSEIERGLAAGGIDFPAALGLTPGDLAGLPATQPAQVRGPDPVANSLAIVVLAGMLLNLGYVGVGFVRAATLPKAPNFREGGVWQRWLIPVLVLVGLIVSGYLSYVKLTQTAAICGPFGDCDAVQLSRYSELFGVPVAVLGFLAYLGILVLWVWGEFGRGRLAEMALLGLFGLAASGTAFSAYLTFLELFVIGAVCLWCVTSAAVMTLILWVASRPVLGTQVRLSTRAG